MNSAKQEILIWQNKIEEIANNLPEDDVCPQCNVHILQGLQKVCAHCQDDNHREARKKYIHENIFNILKEKGVGKRHLECSFDNFEIGKNEKTVLFFKSITRNLTDSILLYSPTPGNGKTHLATATLRRVLLSGYEDCHFVPAPNIFLEIKQSYGSGQSDLSEKWVIDKYCGINFLIVDDIGAERVSDWTMQIWYMIVSRRESEMRPTLYTSNLSLSEIKNVLGARIASRLSGGYVFELLGNDYRLNNRKQI